MENKFNCSNCREPMDVIYGHIPNPDGDLFGIDLCQKCIDDVFYRLIYQCDLNTTEQNHAKRNKNIIWYNAKK